MYYAHTKFNPVTGENLSPDYWQPLLEHLQNVAAIAQQFGDSFGSGEIARICGLFHDLGKYSERFQRHLSEGGNPVDHSTAGAVELSKRLDSLGFLLAYCVAGHHAGLPDGGSAADTPDEPTLHARLRKKTESYDGYRQELDPLSQPYDLRLPIAPLGQGGFSLSFYIRMLYSCLVDGDFLDTEKAMNGEIDRKIGEEISTLAVRLEQYIGRFDNSDRPIDRMRTQILKSCVAKAAWDKGLYTLTVPTGSGKTISSLAFALKHANFHRMKRVIYVIPYNSIIEQNAAVFKDILGEENVLEHHSNFNYDDSSEKLIRQRLATENWDMPVIVTTTVQFFESIFANRSSKCRKLHNLADSVVIFDDGVIRDHVNNPFHPVKVGVFKGERQRGDC
ncbi:MAG TPA: CRISPR-associated endonuclease Cas3'', partial [Clostridia bacterium]|nr:CRISPR-associated endonuclease Cas3'' [Clostridia bacterium]